MKIEFILTNEGTLHLYANNKNYTVSKEHVNYENIKDAIRMDNADDLESLINIPKSITAFSNDVVTYIDDKFYYQGKELKNSIVDRIFSLKKENLPFEHMTKFLDNIMKNPSEKSIDNLLDFLENKALPITEDGCFYAYKRVQDNWKDIYSGKYDNSIGTTLVMERSAVDENENNHCSYGFHVGSIEYVRTYGSGGHILIVKVNPKDVVAVPRDCNCQKCRTCCYTVVGEYIGDLQDSTVYDENLQPIKNDMISEKNNTKWVIDPFSEDDDEDDWNDEEEDWLDDEDEEDEDENDEWNEHYDEDEDEEEEDWNKY